jgi:hypothetical protein
VSESRRRQWGQGNIPPPRARRTRPRRTPHLPIKQIEPPHFIAALAEWFVRFAASPDRLRAATAASLALCGVLLTLIAVSADVTIHRGVGDGLSPEVVQHYTGRDLAANVDLTRYATEQLPDVAAGLRASGIRYARQSFSWAEIEANPGQYTWERYDAIVDALNQSGISVVAVLHGSPTWIRSPGAGDALDAPPADLSAFERFVSALVSRYEDRVQFLQIWDLPNVSSRWGGVTPDAASYVSLLAVGSNAARGANPNAVILLAEFEQLPAAGEPSDLDFLQRVYAAGGSAFFDIVALRLDGGSRSPYDRGTGPERLNLSRAILTRETMVAAGDLTTPIWATHFGWGSSQTGPAAEAAELQARYTIAGLQRARAEWPWMGPLFQWGLIPGPDLGGGTPTDRALLSEDGSPTPLYRALGDFANAGGVAAAPTGLAPVSAHQFVWEGNWDLQHLGTGTYRTTSDVDARVQLPFTGTGLVARARLSREAGDIEAAIDDQSIDVSLGSFQAANIDVPLARRLQDGPHTVSIQLVSPGELTLGGLVVVRTIPMQWPIYLLLGSGVFLLFAGLFDGLLLLAENAGLLQRRRAGELWPELPQMPDWRPARRA